MAESENRNKVKLKASYQPPTKCQDRPHESGVQIISLLVATRIVVPMKGISRVRQQDSGHDRRETG